MNTKGITRKQAVDVALPKLGGDGRLKKIEQVTLQNDREMLRMLVDSILANKRLVWYVVDAYLKQNGYLLLDKDEKILFMGKRRNG